MPSDSQTAARDYSDLHQIIDRLEPDQVEELRRHALRLVKTPPPSRFRVLRSFDGPATDLGARTKDILREELGEADADRWHRPPGRPAQPPRPRPQALRRPPGIP